MRTDCSRASGRITSTRRSAPRRSSRAPRASSSPLRRHDSGCSHHARRGVVVYPSPGTGPSMPSSISDVASSCVRSGRNSRSTRSTSACFPTGSTSANCCDWVSLADRPDSRFTRIDHHPNGRHRSGWCTSNACTRPGGSVSVMVVNSPNVMRTPATVGAIE